MQEFNEGHIVEGLDRCTTILMLINELLDGHPAVLKAGRTDLVGLSSDVIGRLYQEIGNIEGEEKAAAITVLSRSSKKAVSSTPNIDLISKANIDVDVINGLAMPRLNHWMSVRNFKSAKVGGVSAWRAKLSEWGYVCVSDAGSVMITGIKDGLYAQEVASAEGCG